MTRVTRQFGTGDRLRAVLRNHQNPIMSAMLTQWGVRWRAAMQRRFASMSRGGWTPLKPETVRAKERKGSRTPSSILRDRSLLFHALDAVMSGQPGQFERRYDLGVELGIGGTGTYPQSSITVGEVAAIHHMGRGRLPTRPIVAEDRQVIRGMMDDARRALMRLRSL